MKQYFQDFPCHSAVFNGNVEVVKSMNVPDINQTDERGLTPLHVAVLSQQEEIAAYLIKNGAEVNAQTDVVLSSSNNQYRDRAKSIFNKANAPEWELKMPFDSNVTALHLACAVGLESVVSLLLEHKAKVNLRSSGGASALHYAALWGYGEIVKILVGHKSKFDFKIKSQSTAGWFDADMTVLHAAAQSGNCGIIKTILEKGCSVNDYTKGGCGVIFFAARSGNSEAVKMLLEAGASAETKMPRYFNNPLNESILRFDVDSTALLIKNVKQVNGIEAEENGRKVFLWQPPIRAAIRYQHAAITQLLLEAGCSRPVYEQVEDTLFFGDLEEVIRFYDQGERPKGSGFSGYSILFEAVERGHYELVKFLLDNGCDENISRQEENSRHKNTPLHIATLGLISSSHPLEDKLHKKRSYQIAEILLEKGADPNAVDAFGNIPMHNAVQQEDQEMIELLLKHGSRSIKPNIL